MSYKSEFASNNTEINANNVDIQTAIDMVNALPNAGSGASVDTCTVYLKSDSFAGYALYACTRYVDGAFVVQEVTYAGDGVSLVNGLTIENVLCGSALFVKVENELYNVSVNNGSTSKTSSMYSFATVVVTTTPNVTTEIILTCD